MDPADYLRIGLGALRGHRLRSFLSMLGIAIGIAAVILLTSIGEGTRRYLITEFTQFGTNVLAINPGKTETSGLPGVFGGTTPKLTLDDWQQPPCDRAVCRDLAVPPHEPIAPAQLVEDVWTKDVHPAHHVTGLFEQSSPART